MCKCIASVVAVAMLTVAAAASAVEITATAGFGGMCRSGCWTPISVWIKNTSDERITGSIATIDPMSGAASPYQTRADLPGPSEKRFSHCLKMQQSIGEVAVKLWPDKGSIPGGKAVVAKARITDVPQGSVLVAAAGPQSAALNFLSGAKLNSAVPSRAPGSPALPAPTTTPTHANHQIFTGWVDPITLPDRPAAYESVNLLVLSEVMPGRLPTKQLKALKMWVATGGKLAVNGGPNFQILENSFYSDLLPVNVLGAAQISSLSGLPSRYGKIMPPGSAVVTSCKPKDGAEVVVSQDGLPLITRWNYGLGYVYFLSFDYSSPVIKGWDGQTEMWKDIITSDASNKPLAYRDYQPGSQDYGYYDGEVHTIPGIAQNMPSVTTPSIEVLGLFLLGYLMCLVPVNYFALNRWKKRELAWVTTPAIILLFTIGAYGMGYTMKGGKLLFKTVTVVEAGAGQRYASSISYSGLFSPSRRSYDLAVADPFALVTEGNIDMEDPYGSPRRNTQRQVKILMDETTTLPETAMDMWSMRTFNTVSGCDLGGAVEPDLQFDWDKLRLTGKIRNNTDFDLRDCKILYAGQQIKIDSIRRKSTATINAAIPGPPKNIDAYGIPMHAQAGEPRADVQTELNDLVMAQLNDSGPPILIATSDEALTALQMPSGKMENHHGICFVLRLPPPAKVVAPKAEAVTGVSEEYDSNIIKTSPGAVITHGPTGQTLQSGWQINEFNMTTNGGLIDRLAIEPATSGNPRVRDILMNRWLQVDKIQLSLGGRPSVDPNPFKYLKLYCYNQRKGVWVHLGQPSGHGGRMIFEIPSPASCAMNGRVRIKFEAKGGMVELSDVFINLTAKGGA